MARRVLDRVDIRISGDGHIDALIQTLMDVWGDINMVILEYVKNSLDSAVEMQRESGQPRMPYPVTITVFVNPDKGEVRILDNCRGMDAAGMSSIVTGAFLSRKRGMQDVRGKAGFGAHAFRSYFTDAAFRSKRRGGPLLELCLKRGIGGISGIPVSELSGSDDGFPYESGTLVVLSGLQPTRGKQAALDAEAIRREAERRLQRHLDHPDISITVVGESASGAVEMPCNPTGVTFGVNMRIHP